MHFLLVGPGAMGCLLCAAISRGLATSKVQLSLLDHSQERADYLSERGIIYQRDETQEIFPVTATADPRMLPPVDVILLCVKSYDVAASLDLCRPLLRENTLVLFLQNGIGHLEMRDHLGEATAAFATTTEGATLLARGHVRHAGSGSTSLGFLHTPSRQETWLLQQTHTALAAGSMQVYSTGNILTKIWEKLFINVGINALTATLDCKNGELLTLPGVDRRMKNGIDEALLVARAEGIEVTDDPYHSCRIVCRKTAENISSMLQDVRNRRPTEIEAINGAIVARAFSHAINTPENSLLCRQVKKLEAGYLLR
jgi:2-dehydropantoate 2-reductase